MPADTDLAHQCSSRHRHEILRSETCGCFYCFGIYAPAEIVEWVDDETTALCPKCGIDSVIGSASGWPIEVSFLGKMYRRWFKAQG